MIICYHSLSTMILYHLNSKHTNALTIIFLSFSLLLFAAPSALAQDETNHANDHYTTSTSFNLTFTLIFLTFIILFIAIAFMVVLFSFGGPFSGISARRASNENESEWVDPMVEQSGLDRSVLDTFPIMKFCEVRELNPSMPECAVCLSEYNDSDTLRILPGCCHVFHPECIDNWLSNHDVCPICRASLSNLKIVSTELQPETGIDGVIVDDERHKMWISMKGAERFTVKLPEHVLRQIKVQRGYKLTASIAGSGYQGAPMSNSGRIWAFIRTLSSKQGEEVGGGSKTVRLSSSLHRSPTLGKNGSITEMALVQSISVSDQADGVTSGMVPVQSDLVRGQTDAVVRSSTVLIQSYSVRNQTDIVKYSTELVQSGSVRGCQTDMVGSSTESVQSCSVRSQNDGVISTMDPERCVVQMNMVSSNSEPVPSCPVKGSADMVTSEVHRLDQV